MKCRLIAAAALGWALAGNAGAVGNAVDVTIYDRFENRALPVYRHEGRYYIVGKPGNEYQVRVRNRAGTDILTVVSVDGVNAVSGETADWNQTGYVLGPGQSFDVKGWRKSMERTAAFFFTEHQYSYAARTGRPDNVGVIGVAMYRRKAEPQAIIPHYRYGGPRAQSNDAGSSPGAAAESAPSAAAADSAAQRYAPAPQAPEKSLGTGHGRSETSRVTYTEFERATPAPEEVVVIHYDTYNNLAAMGVIRAPRIAMPTPFPGQFVPDPR